MSYCVIMIHIKSIFEDGDVLGVSLQRRLNGKRRTENGECDTPRRFAAPLSKRGGLTRSENGKRRTESEERSLTY